MKEGSPISNHDPRYAENTPQIPKSESFEVQVGGTTYHGYLRVTVDLIRSTKNPCRTAWHEAKHIIPALVNGTGVEGASIESDSNSLGRTYLSEFDPVAALAPDADGCNGTSWDVYIAESRGENNFVNRARGRSILGSHKRHVRGMAEFLDEKKSIGKKDISAKMEELNAGEPPLLSYDTEDGYRGEFKLRTEDSHVKVVRKSNNELALAA